TVLADGQYWGIAAAMPYRGDASSPRDVHLQQNPVVGVAGSMRALVMPILIDLEDDFVGGVALRKRDVLHMGAAQEIHDVVVKDEFLVQIAGGQERVICISLVV